MANPHGGTGRNLPSQRKRRNDDMKPLSEKTFAAFYLPMFAGFFIFMAVGSTAWSHHLKPLAIVCFALFGLCFTGIIFGGIYFAIWGENDLDRLLRRAQARQERRARRERRRNG